MSRFIINMTSNLDFIPTAMEAPMSTKNDITDKYILSCKLLAHDKTTRYKNKKSFLSDAEFQEIYDYECSRCLEKYYTHCLKEVMEISKKNGGRKNIALCDKIVDMYFQHIRPRGGGGGGGETK